MCRDVPCHKIFPNFLSDNKLYKPNHFAVLATLALKKQRLIWKLFATPDTSNSYVKVRNRATYVVEWLHGF
jgi:hypothetical protein